MLRNNNAKVYFLKKAHKQAKCAILLLLQRNAVTCLTTYLTTMRKLTTLQAQIALLKNAANVNVAAQVLALRNTANAANVVYVSKQRNTSKHARKNIVCVTKMRISAAATHTSINPVTVQQYVRVVKRVINTVYFNNNKVISAATAQQYAAKQTVPVATAKQRAYAKVIAAQNAFCTINAQNCVSFAKCKQA